MRRALSAIFALALISGCGRKPHAPALRDEPVYENSRAGVRFRSPDGWVQIAKSDPPENTGSKDVLLVRYQDKQAQAFFELTRANLPESENLEGQLAEPSHGSDSPWQKVSGPEDLSVGGAPAKRFIFSSKSRTKETVAVRRGGHVFFFTLVIPGADEQSRQLIRRVVTDVKWN